MEAAGTPHWGELEEPSAEAATSAPATPAEADTSAGGPPCAELDASAVPETPAAGDWLWLYASFGGGEHELQLDPHTLV